MLVSLAIRNLVLIESLDLEFHAGLGVLTGETGAGKSILLDALGLCLGMRADSNLVQAGADRASASAVFELANPAPVLNILNENDIQTEDGESLIIRRQVKVDGGSRAFINDQPVSASLLRQLAPFLVEIHGQHDDRGLLNPRGHRDLLDSFGGCNTASVAKTYAVWKEAESRYQIAVASIETALADRELLAYNITELQEFGAQPGEETELAGERSDMQKGERLTGDLVHIIKVFDGSNSPLSKLRSAARRLDRIAADHPLLASALAALDGALIEADSAENSLREASIALTYDAERLEAIETRLFALRALARKHNIAGDGLPDYLAELEAQWEALESGGANVDTLDKARTAARIAFEEAAAKLTQQRKSAGAALDKAVAKELVPLKLDAARFKTAVTPLAADKWGAGGADHLEFLISTNPGSDFAPLTKIASGGELSRFILALKVALAEKTGAATMVFDEIDRGVGGAVASAIGDRLARLSAGGQVLVVTHSPQVAARGNTHMQIAKASDGKVARTSVRALDAAGRQEEIARMLSGAEVTAEARAQADRLLERV